MEIFVTGAAHGPQAQCARARFLQRFYFAQANERGELVAITCNRVRGGGPGGSLLPNWSAILALVRAYFP